jgi:tungstate transport system ATP-binding protein
MNPYEIQGLRFEYARGFALDIEAFRLREGEKVAIVGRNGSGKTTFLRLLSFMERPKRWRVFRHWGMDVDPSRPCRTDLGVLRQHPWIFRGTVGENLAFALRARGTRGAAIGERVEDMARRLDLLHHLRAPARTLSGGEQRRLALGRVLIGQPRVLLLDEPTAHLDGRSLEIIGSILKASDAAFLVTTHDTSFAISVASRVMVLNEGRIERVEAHRSGAERGAGRQVEVSEAEGDRS